MQTLDLKSVKPKDLQNMNLKFLCQVTKTGLMHGLCVWFDVGFTPLDSKDQIILSTSPESPKTHWKQATIMFPEGFEIDAGTPVPGCLMFSQDQRRYNLTVQLGYTE